MALYSTVNLNVSIFFKYLGCQEWNTEFDLSNLTILQMYETTSVKGVWKNGADLSAK